ncbi:MAG TPA: cyclase family protein [Acidimicrobiia bacterium]|nr:cyclase family protein [Acidimicrobiia bacterium]
MTRLIDLSQTIEADMTTYPGLPGPVITEHLSRADSREHYQAGTEFLIGRIDMVGNTGTYLDTPFHRYEEGFDLDGLALEGVADLPGVVVDEVGPELGPETIEGVEVAGRAVLFHTGWDRHWRTDGYGDPGHPFVSARLASALVEAGATLVGIDSVNIDDTRGGSRPAHSGLLGAGIPVVEHLTGLGGLVGKDFRFFAVPPKVRGFGTFPVRAFALVR